MGFRSILFAGRPVDRAAGDDANYTSCMVCLQTIISYRNKTLRYVARPAILNDPQVDAKHFRKEKTGRP